MIELMKLNKINCECDVTHPEKIYKVQSQRLEDEKIETMAQLFHMFSNPTRAKIMHILSIEELCVCDLAFVMKMTKSAISHQLALLKDAKLVKNRREGKMVYYSLDDEHVEKILTLGFDHSLESH